MKKFYFENSESEFCYLKSFLIEKAKEEQLKEVEFYEAIQDKNSGYFYCRHFGVVCENSDVSCGKYCDAYNPKNGKTGMCKAKGICYMHGEKVKFKIK